MNPLYRDFAGKEKDIKAKTFGGRIKRPYHLSTLVGHRSHKINCFQYSVISTQLGKDARQISLSKSLRSLSFKPRRNYFKYLNDILTGRKDPHDKNSFSFLRTCASLLKISLCC